MTFVAPHGSNTYVPTLQENLIISFSRNESKFAINQYAQIVPVDRDVGYYTKMEREEAGRITDTDGRQHTWADGADRPTHHGELEHHEFAQYTTVRKEYGCTLGYKATKQASFEVKAKQIGVQAERAMRFRTQRALSQLLATGNYDASHVLTVSSVSGNTGNWEQSTTARTDIKRSLHYAAQLIDLDTLNSVEAKDLILVMSPGCARKMATSQEIVDYLKASPEALAQVRGEGRNSAFGLPDTLYGYKVVIENTAKVTTRKGASSVSRSYIMADATPVLMARVGALVDERMPKSQSFSTLSLFTYEDMTVEEKDDSWNRRWQASMVDDFAPVLTAPVSAVLFQSAVS